MPDLDLKPQEYRVTRGPLQRLPKIHSTKAWMWMFSVCGVWMATVYYAGAEDWIDGPWPVLLGIAVAPAILTLIWWFLSGAEDHHD